MRRTSRTSRTSRRPGRATATLTAALLCLAAAGTLPAAASAPGPAVVNAGAPGAVEGSYLVVLDGGTARTVGAELADRYGVRVAGTYDSALTGLHVLATAPQARRLAADPAVRLVEQDTAVAARPAATQPDPPNCGLDRIDQPDLPLDRSFTFPDSAGEGATAYIVDTGIAYGHQDFGGRARPGHDVTGGDGSDGNGHGTHVAGLVGGAEHGVAKAADLVSVKVLDASGAGTLAGVVEGIDWLTADARGRSAVALLTLGGAPSDVLDRAVRASIASGVTYAVAAGGGADDAGNYSPGRVTEAITVAASSCDDRVASFTNLGPAVDLFAPGVGITSAWPDGGDGTAALSGTSASAAFAAGVAALHLADHPGTGPAALGQAMDEAAAVGRLTGVPPGTPNKLLQVI
ncbi:S8 family peptidase [Streptomyces johnsoniae]|uniref:S8 family peptidase n=1 Tax=Streptomyces johnsoniae TaxID=3075532 RepID=A0ABU2SDL9_9ACTN|nr:S8 family peptidase [Streptomyces sp. DSM 41886]MDT0447072.1 S8 family peptidase [Streptomyces sp. DSM 41886]